MDPREQRPQLVPLIWQSGQWDRMLARHEMWVFALADLFRRGDLGGGWKVLWLFAIVLLPLIGVIIYFLVRRPSREVSMELPADATAGDPSAER